MDEKSVTNVKEVIVIKYGNINNFVDEMIIKNQGKLPLSRPYLYKLINHDIKNPGIKTLNKIAEMLDIPVSDVYEEYSK